MNYWITLQKRFSIDFHLKIESVAQLIWKQNHALLRMCRSPLRHNSKLDVVVFSSPSYVLPL